MNAQESGKLGGTATRDNHITLCPLCGAPKKNQFLADTGQKGGETTLKRYGREFYAQIGRLGGRGNKRNGRGCLAKDQPLPERSGTLR